jgi:S-adenosylmethionine-diacylglycerol 3-amino-3-carboxypropyl transferase
MSDVLTVKEQLGAAVHQNAALSKTGLLERIFSNAFNGLVYPQIWEDPDVDMAALAIEPHHNLVCIASGGCNMMSYLTAGPASITAVDLSPAHVALNRLKLAAAQHLADHETFYALFGRGNVKGNAELFDHSLALHLDAASVDYWNGRRGINGRRIEMFEDGFYRQGLLGWFIGSAHLLARLFGVDLKTFLACTTLEEQKAWFDANLAPVFETRLVRWLAGNKATLIGLGIPPQQYDALAGAAGGDMLAVLRERTRALFCDYPLSENYFAWQAVNRAYKREGDGPVPPYLRAENFEALKANAGSAAIHNRSLTDLLAETPAGSKHGYVLLDAQDWMNDRQLNDLWSQITRTAAPGARVIFRTAGIPTILPGRVDDAIMKRWTYHARKSASWTRADRSAIYGGFHLYTLDG